MRTIKRTLVLTLMIVVMMAVMAMSAAALENGWPDRIAQFQEVGEYNDDVYPGYVSVAQRFFMCYPATIDSMGSSTVDGDFGPCSTEALRKFRSLKGLSANDLMDSNAWRALAKELDSATPYYNPTRFILDETSGHVMLVGVGQSSYSYYYYTGQYGLNSSYAFHVG